MRPGLLRSSLAIAGSAVVVATLTACGGNAPPAESCTPKGGTSNRTAAAQTVQVVPDPNTVGAYEPKTVTVKKGGTLEWDFTDQGSQHSVTADDGSFDSGLCNAGAKFFVSFSNSGTFNYHCTIHAAMTGTVTVS